MACCVCTLITLCNYLVVLTMINVVFSVTLMVLYFGDIHNIDTVENLVDFFDITTKLLLFKMFFTSRYSQHVLSITGTRFFSVLKFALLFSCFLSILEFIVVLRVEWQEVFRVFRMLRILDVPFMFISFSIVIEVKKRATESTNLSPEFYSLFCDPLIATEGARMQQPVPAGAVAVMDTKEGLTLVASNPSSSYHTVGPPVEDH